MIHIEIFFCIFTLMIGSWLVYYTFQLSRTTPHSFLKPITLFILFYNLSILMRLVAQYTCANILASCFVFNASIYSKMLAPFAFAINLGMTLSLIAIVFHFLEKQLPRRSKPWIVGLVIIILLSYSVRIIFGSQPFLLPWLPLFHQYIYLTVVLIGYASLFYLLIGSRKEGEPAKKSMVRSFAIFYIVAYTSLILSFIFQPVLQYFFIVVVHLLFNIFLILWLRYSFRPYHRNSISAIMGEGMLEGFYQERRISKREKEIAELILQGKSNKEIEQELYISPHTVKNHIYSLYQKAGVNSRGQLIFRMLESNQH